MPPSSLLNLPPELILLVNDHLSLKECASLASVARPIRNLLLPCLFSVIRITNREKDAEGIRNVIAKHGHHAGRLFFRCYYYYPMLEIDTETPDNAPESLPDYIADLLSGQQLSYDALSIEFSGLEGDTVRQGPDMEIGLEEEDEEDARTLEEEIAWRSIHKQIWLALSANKSITALDIHNLPPRESSVWWETPWEQFLSRLTKLSLGVWGEEDLYHSNGEFLYRDFMSRLNETFFDHATNLKQLRVAASRRNPYGATPFDYGEYLSWNADVMNKLEIFEIESCLLDENLLDFLKAHSQVLRELRMIECHSCDINTSQPAQPLTWSKFFTALIKSDPILEKLQITNSRVPLTADEEILKKSFLDENGEYIPPELETLTEERSDEDVPEGKIDEARRIRAEIKSGDRKVFSYVEIDDKYAMLFSRSGRNLEEYLEGDDNREFENLMSLVNQNAARSCGEQKQRDDEWGYGRCSGWRKERIHPAAFDYSDSED